MKKIVLPIGKREEEILLPEDKILYDIHGNPAAERESIAEAALEAIRNPIGTKPLKELVVKGEKIAVVVSDITRMVGTAGFLPVIINELNEAGIADNDITIIIATGTHRAHTPEEDAVVCGKDIVKRIKIHQHDCRNKDELVEGILWRNYNG